jgi:transcriptional regulator with XRE-family HTH domain
MVSDNIKMLRNARGFSQEHMAVKTGLGQAKYSRVESGEVKPSEEALKLIAAELGVSTADLKSNFPFVIYNMQSNEGTQISYNETFNNCEKALYEKIIATKDDLIASKDAQITQLMQLLHKK